MDKTTVRVIFFAQQDDLIVHVDDKIDLTFEYHAEFIGVFNADECVAKFKKEEVLLIAYNSVVYDGDD